MDSDFTERVRAYFMDYIAMESRHKNDPYVTGHCYRYVESVLFIEHELRASKTALEVGVGAGVFADGIRFLFPGIALDTSEKDLRGKFTDHIDFYDLITNMEVIEHIKDKDMPEDWRHRDTWFGDGIKNFVDTCYACLKPGGKMFLTTPNLSSFNTLLRVLNYDHPFGYEPHNRELAINDVKRILLDAGFKIERFSTSRCCASPVPAPLAETKSKLAEFMRSMGYSTDSRDEYQFVLAEKPGLPAVP